MSTQHHLTPTTEVKGFNITINTLPNVHFYGSFWWCLLKYRLHFVCFSCQMSSKSVIFSVFEVFLMVLRCFWMCNDVILCVFHEMSFYVILRVFEVFLGTWFLDVTTSFCVFSCQNVIKTCVFHVFYVFLLTFCLKLVFELNDVILCVFHVKMSSKMVIF